MYRKPTVAILSTGNELLDLQAPPHTAGTAVEEKDGWGGIWDTNRPSLQAALEGMGYDVVDLGIVADELSLYFYTSILSFFFFFFFFASSCPPINMQLLTASKATSTRSNADWNNPTWC